MKKKYLKTLLLLPVAALVLSSCRPTVETSSQEPHSDYTSSESISSSEPTSSSAASSESSSSSEKQSSSEESSEDISSSEQTSSEQHSGEQHSSEQSSSEEISSEQQSSEEQSSEQYTSEQQSSEEISSEQSSEQSSEEQSSEEVEEELVKMNKEILNLSFVDPFEVRDYLIESGYDFMRDLGDGKRYGYSQAHAKVVIYQNNKVIEPENCVNDQFVNYAIVTVNSFNDLYNAVNGLNNGSVNYSTIKLGSNITQTADSSLVQYTAKLPLEIDLNNKTILAPNAVNKDYKTEKWFTLQFLDKTHSSKVYVHGGTIEANRYPKEDGVEDDACALSLAGGGSFRLNNLTLRAKNGTQCVGDYSQYINSNGIDQSKKIVIDNVNMYAPLRAMTIAGGDWNVKNSNLYAMTVIDGGKVVIDNCVVDATNAVVDDMNRYTKGYTNSELMVTPVTKLNGKAINTTVPYVLKGYPGAVTFNDAILVTSRRLPAYSPSDVTVKNCSLSPVVVNNVVTGYGFRYWDLAGYSGREAINPTLINNTYPQEDGSGFGGSNYGS